MSLTYTLNRIYSCVSRCLLRQGHVSTIYCLRQKNLVRITIYNSGKKKKDSSGYDFRCWEHKYKKKEKKNITNHLATIDLLSGMQ